MRGSKLNSCLSLFGLPTSLEGIKQNELSVRSWIMLQCSLFFGAGVLCETLQGLRGVQVIHIHTGAAAYLGSGLDKLDAMPVWEPAKCALAQRGETVVAIANWEFPQYLDWVILYIQLFCSCVYKGFLLWGWCQCSFLVVIIFLDLHSPEGNSSNSQWAGKKLVLWDVVCFLQARGDERVIGGKWLMMVVELCSLFICCRAAAATEWTPKAVHRFTSMTAHLHNCS